METNELKCTDLRIGNYVKRGNILCEIAEIYEEAVYCYDKYGEDSHTINVVEPIELTEEVLLKIGFKKNVIYDSVIEYFPIDDNLARIFCTKEKQNFKIQIVRKNITETIVKYIKYLHQLQNAYYILTNKEMKIEL